MNVGIIIVEESIPLGMKCFIIKVVTSEQLHVEFLSECPNGPKL